MSNTTLIEQLKRHEGLRLEPYLCTAGRLTIGYGRNISDIGITEQEADQLLANDIKRVKAQLKKHLAWYTQMTLPRKAVFENMLFNLGLSRFMQFHNTLAAAHAGDYATAADEMLDSRWARQVGQRAQELSQQMRTGEWQ